MIFRTLTKMIFTVAVGTLLYYHTAYAQALTVTAQGGPDYGPNYIRWDQFSADLTADQGGKPTPQNEATLNAPTYSWSCSNSHFKLTGDQTLDHVTLVSTPNPSKSSPLQPGPNSITVTATAHWSDDKGNSYPPSTGSVTVTFFVRVPTSVNLYAPKRTEPHDYGSRADIYSFKMYDNQDYPMAYGNGLIREEFSHYSFMGQPDPTGSPNYGGGTTAVLNKDTNDYADGTGSPIDQFVDVNYWPVLFDPAGTGMKYGDLMQSFDQKVHCEELTPPYNVAGANLYVTPGKFRLTRPDFTPHPDTKWPGNGDFLENVFDTTALPTNHVEVYYGFTVRSFPHDPYPDSNPN